MLYSDVITLLWTSTQNPQMQAISLIEAIPVCVYELNK